MNKELSKREQEVASLYARGHSATEIAKLLNLSPKTIESHKKRVRTKLSIIDRVQWMAFLRTLPV